VVIFETAGDSRKLAHRLHHNSVGPYWFVRDSDDGNIRLIAHRCMLTDAEKYGDCLTCPHGHYDLWEGWKLDPPEGLTSIVRDFEYEEWPRGRVVFDFVKNQFIVYGDKQVFRHKLQGRVLEYFGIPADQVTFDMKDGHYQSTRSLF
jgi:hypothetical protein